jgi:hypothetical protein
VADVFVRQHIITVAFSSFDPSSQRDFSARLCVCYFAMATSTVSNSPSSTSAAASATCTTAVPGKYGYVPPDACNSNYNYDPQFAPAVAVAVIFGIFTLVHLVLAIVFRKVRTCDRARASRAC